jgi:hypothetical protein
MAYCGRCRIGTIDAQGLCVLCGAPATPPTRRGRAAERLGGLLSALLSPAALGAAAAVGLLVAVAAVTQYGTRVPAGVPRLGALAPPTPGGAAQAADPGGLVLRLLLPALIQALLFTLLLLLVLYVLNLWRRRRPTSPPEHLSRAGPETDVRSLEPTG